MLAECGLQLRQAKEKLDKSYSLVSASLVDFPAYDAKKQYTAKEQDPYNALSERFIRSVETFILFLVK